jgi:hypothetical protein
MGTAGNAGSTIQSRFPATASSSRSRMPANSSRGFPNADHEAAEWQAAMEALILVAESGGPTMFARIGAMRALNLHIERVFNSDRKEHHWGRRRLARDR